MSHYLRHNLSHYLSQGLIVFLTLLLCVSKARTVSAEVVVVAPTLADAAAALPIKGIQDALKDLYGKLEPVPNKSNTFEAKKTFNMPGLGSVPLKLYVFGNAGRNQTVLLVINRTIMMPTVIPKKIAQKLAGTKLTDTIFSLSLVDSSLHQSKMPTDLKNIVKTSYFNIDSLQIPSGMQVMARASIQGELAKAIKAGMGVPVDNFLLRAGVVIPIPTDVRSGAGFLLSMPSSPKDVPQGQIEFQLEPGKAIQTFLSAKKFTDATISIDTSLVFGFKGNVILPSGKKFLSFLRIPIPTVELAVNPLIILDWADFEFGLSTPALTLADAVTIGMSRSVSKAPGSQYLMPGVEKYLEPLQQALKPLATFKIQNPVVVPDYKFGKDANPFPSIDAFNILLLGPLASVDGIDGPVLKVAGNVSVLGEQLGSMSVYMDAAGLRGTASADLSLRLGPLSPQSISMTARVEITDKKQVMSLSGSISGRSLTANLDNINLTIRSDATCAAPFSLSSVVPITANLSLSAQLDRLPGVNIDPALISGCVGEELQQALNWITTTGSSLGGYSANAAQAEIDRAYNSTKDAARNVAESSTNSARSAFKSAGNALRGKKKKHHKGPDPKFAASVFDWDYYYDVQQDVVRAGVDLSDHWQSSGFYESRQGSFEFSARYYLNRYSDLRQRCGQDLNCALNHWLEDGLKQGRQGSPRVSITDYMLRYADLRNFFGDDNFSDAMDHWINGGKGEGRLAYPDSTSTQLVSGPKPIGGGGGNHWSELGQCRGQAVNGFRLRYGGSIDTVQFSYVNHGWASQHGYSGSGAFPVDVMLEAGEYIIQVDYNAGSMVDKLKFITNRRVYGPYGGGGFNGSYIVTPGERLGCMSGSAGSSIDKLIFTSTGPH